MAESWDARVSAVAALDEPTRRRLYDFVVRQPAPVSREEAAAAADLARTTAAFHLDKLAEEGLLEVVHERRTGRSGPGAGRPSKLYRRSARQIAVSLPDRRYELVGDLLAAAVQEADGSGESPRSVLARRARELGQDIGETARSAGPGEGSRDAVLRALESYGFEPRTADTAIVLGNCPFHSLAKRHTDLVCGMNVCLIDGLLHGLAVTDLTASLHPEPDHCCVRVEPAAG